MMAFLNLLTAEQLSELSEFYANQPGLVTLKR